MDVLVATVFHQESARESGIPCRGWGALGSGLFFWGHNLVHIGAHATDLSGVSEVGHVLELVILALDCLNSVLVA